MINIPNTIDISGIAPNRYPPQVVICPDCNTSQASHATAFICIGCGKYLIINDSAEINNIEAKA